MFRFLCEKSGFLANVIFCAWSSVSVCGISHSEISSFNEGHWGLGVADRKSVV